MLRHESVPFIELKLSRPRTHRGLLIAVSLLAVFLWLGQTHVHQQSIEITYTEFKTLVRERRVAQVLLLGDQVHGLLNDPIQPRPDTEPSRYVTTNLTTGSHRKLGSFLAQYGLPLTIRPMINPLIGPIGPNI